VVVGKGADLQAAQLVRELAVAPGVGGLALQVRQPAPDFAQDVLHALQVLVRVLHAALGLGPARLVLGDARGLLKDVAPLLALDGEDLVDAALADEGIALLADARVAQQVDDVLQAAGGLVEAVLAVAVAVDAPGDHHLGKGDGQRPVLVVKDEADLAVGLGLARLRSAEDDVLHLGAAQGLCALFAQDPADRVGDVALAAAVGPDHARHPVREDHLHAVRKGLEPVDFQSLQSQCSALTVPAGSARRARPAARRAFCCCPRRAR